ncbi:hypothetical protein OEZ85_010595 [Tetradesmus obliquus]|uniref:PDZ domain-containing protein n=1 Tax=Tetradesmus obliquus TaxID=3088 RepID=A0ABY8TPW9_TETOB|nr:hypothetical protein OEZ85_010595 [Tetradesmus obliquus]
MLAAAPQYQQPHSVPRRLCNVPKAQASGAGGPEAEAGNALLSKLGALAAGAAIFFGGYTTGIASSSMVADVRTAESHRQEITAPAPASLPVKPVSLALPDQAAKETVQAAQQAGLAADELSTIRVFQANTPSVVNVTNIRAMQSYYSMDVERIPAGTGSGFVWDRQGHVVTNFHVIKGASEVKVTLLDQSTYSAKVVGFDPDKDVAVLQLDMPEEARAALQPVSLGSSTGLMVGQRVYAIGNPFGLDHTLTQGIISGLGRELSTGLYPIKNVIQTDAAINPGNSGGVLLDSKGNLIGINTAIADPTGKGSSSGVGFAIPIDTVKGLVGQILQYGRVMRPSLGVVIAPPQALQRIGEKGVLVLDVTPGSPAERAGLRPTSRNAAGDLILGDIITSVDGAPVASARDLLEQLDAKRVGDKVVVDVLRGGRQRLSFSLLLADRVLGSGTE